MFIFNYIINSNLSHAKPYQTALISNGRLERFAHATGLLSPLSVYAAIVLSRQFINRAVLVPLLACGLGWRPS
jgi:hypothetical protein